MGVFFVDRPLIYRWNTRTVKSWFTELVLIVEEYFKIAFAWDGLFYFTCGKMCVDLKKY